MPARYLDPNRVSIVIPTQGRKHLIEAVESAIGQVCPGFDMEVIVVVNSLVEGGLKTLERLPSEVLIVHIDGDNANIARNEGVKRGTGYYVAFLDDDDIWLDSKIHAQILRGKSIDSESWITTSAVRTFGAGTSEKWPDRAIRSNESIPSFMMRRESVQQSPRWLQTSSWFAPTSVFIENPFDENVVIHQDIDWMVRNSSRVLVDFSTEVLVLYRKSDEGSSMTSRSKAEDSVRWVLLPYLSIAPELRSDFLLCVSSTFAVRNGDIKNLLFIARAAFKMKSFTFCSVAVLLVRALSTLRVRIGRMLRESRWLKFLSR